MLTITNRTDGNILYSTTSLFIGQLIQFDLLAGSSTDILNSAVTLYNQFDSLTTNPSNYYPGPSDLLMGPDDRIYAARWSNSSPSFISAVENPSILGLGCNYTDTAMFFSSGIPNIGLPNLISNCSEPVRIVGQDSVCLGTGAQSYEIHYLGACPLPSRTWEYHGNNPISIQSDSLVILDPLVGGTDTLIFNWGTSCQTDTMFIEVLAPPTLYLGSDTALCQIDSLMLSVDSSSFESYQWQDNSTENFYFVNNPGTYSITTTDICGNIFSDSITISKSSPDSDTVSFFACNGDFVIVNGGSIGTGQSRVINYSNIQGCDSIVTYTVNSFPSPNMAPFIFEANATDTTLDISESNNIIIDVGNDQSSSGISYTWSEIGGASGNANISNENAASTITSPDVSGTYIYEVIATTTDGCISKDTLTLLITDYNFGGMPTAFTPNGDDLNDLYRPINIAPEYVLKFSIFNRFGNMVYSSSDLVNDGWDGTYKGQKQTRDSYIYVLKYQFPDMLEPQTLRGHFMLIR